MVADIDLAAGEAAAQSARGLAANSGGDCQFVNCDVTERASVERAVAETVARYGKLDILHNNAGGSTLEDGPVTEAPEHGILAGHQTRSVWHVSLQQDRHPSHHQAPAAAR